MSNELPGRPGYTVETESRFTDPDTKHHRACACADCRLAGQMANVHLAVPGAPHGVTSACGEFFGTEAFGMVNAPRFSEAGSPATCVKCLAAARLRLVKK